MTEQGFPVVVAAFVVALLAFGFIGVALRRAARSARAAEVSVGRVAARVDEIEGRIQKSEHHLANVRMAIDALPTKDTVNRIDLRVAEVNGKVEAVAQTSIANSRSLERIEHYLLNSKAAPNSPPRSSR